MRLRWWQVVALVALVMVILPQDESFVAPMKRTPDIRRVGDPMPQQNPVSYRTEVTDATFGLLTKEQLVIEAHLPKRTVSDRNSILQEVLDEATRAEAGVRELIPPAHLKDEHAALLARLAELKAAIKEAQRHDEKDLLWDERIQAVLDQFSLLRLGLPK